MKAALGITYRASMFAAIVAGFLTGVSAVPARADADSACAVPAYLIATESVLAKSADAIKTRRQFDILVVGTGSSALSGAEGAAMSYPSRLEAALRSRFPNITVNVTTLLQPKKTAAETAETLSAEFNKIPADRKPVLTIWQTGTADALRNTDPEDFRNGLDGGIAALSKLGTDVMLMNLQYSPRMESVISVAPYVDTMRVVAQDKSVPLFDRFSIMRYWNDAGNFDLFSTTHGYAMAKRVHDCIGRALAAMIVEAAQIKPAELGIAR